MERIHKRFNELVVEAERIAETMDKETKTDPVWKDATGQPAKRTFELIDFDTFGVWRNKAESTLFQVFGPEHPHSVNWKSSRQVKSPHTWFRELRSIVLAAKSDYEAGFLFDIRRLVHADVFADELEQAEHFLDARHKVPAAVIAGTVLESTLRELCRQNEVTVTDKHGNDTTDTASINPINDALTKATTYSRTRAKQVTAWAAIRNDAAHGHGSNFDDAQVRDMISGIRSFVAQQMA